MDRPNQNQPRKQPRKMGCLLLVLFAVASIGFTVWQLREPGRLARENLQHVRPGMNGLDVDRALTGRHYCVYQVQRNSGEWQIVERDEFARIVADSGSREPIKLRLMLTFLSASPGRVSFMVDLDRAGKVQKVNPPYNWD